MKTVLYKILHSDKDGGNDIEIDNADTIFEPPDTAWLCNSTKDIIMHGCEQTPHSYLDFNKGNLCDSMTIQICDDISQRKQPDKKIDRQRS